MRMARNGIARLWIGDLYLEALANAWSYKNHDLTKRCLYLLAALANDEGLLHATVLETPTPHPQNGTHCLDYSLMYNVALHGIPERDRRQGGLHWTYGR